MFGGTGLDRINIDARRAADVLIRSESGRDRIEVLVGSETDHDVEGGPGRDRIEVIDVDRKRKNHHRRGHFHHRDQAFESFSNNRFRRFS